MSTAPSNNRAALPPDELLNYAGRWVAFDPTSTKIVAAHEDPEILAQLVRDAGYDLQEVWFEGIPEEDIILGGLA